MHKTLSVAAIVAATLALQAQAPATPPPGAAAGLVVGSGNFFSPIVEDLDRAVSFYRDGLGLDVAGEPSNADTNPALRDMFGLPDARIRWQIGRTPAVRNGVEIVEISNVTRRAANRRIQDPGAFTLVVLVRDVDMAVKRARQLGAPILTRGGEPVNVGPGASRAVIVADPDGHFVELLQPDPLPQPASSNTAAVLGVRVRLTVENVERTLRLYRDALGLQAGSGGSFAREPRMLEKFGLNKGEYRLASTQVAGSGLGVEFVEFKGVDRKSIKAGIQDPGSTRMQIQVRNLDAAIAALKTAGGTVASARGTTVGLPGRGGTTTRVAIVRDPNNLFLVLIEVAA